MYRVPRIGWRGKSKNLRLKSRKKKPEEKQTGMGVTRRFWSKLLATCSLPQRGGQKPHNPTPGNRRAKAQGRIPLLGTRKGKIVLGTESSKNSLSVIVERGGGKEKNAEPPCQ